MTPGRRPLAFSRPEEIWPDVERLLQGHRAVGRWSLAQVLNHLGSAAIWSIDGFPMPPLPWPIRVTLGSIAKWSMFHQRKIPEGVPLPKRHGPAPELELEVETARFHAAIERVVSHDGPFATHPLFGALTRDQWRQYHCVHCAHHLSFVIPTSTSNGAP